MLFVLLMRTYPQWSLRVLWALGSTGILNHMRLTIKRPNVKSALLAFLLAVSMGGFGFVANESALGSQADLTNPVQKITGWAAGQTQLNELQQQFVGSWTYTHYEKVSDVSCTAFYKVGTPAKQLKVLRQRAVNVCAEVSIALPALANKVSLMPSKVKANQGQIYAKFNFLNIDNQPSIEELAALESFVSQPTNGCPVYDFKKIFFEEYYGKKWGRGKEPFTISWTVNVDSILGDPISRRLSATEVSWIRLAMNSWDEHLSSFQIVESDNPDANIKIGIVSEITSSLIWAPNAYFKTVITPTGERVGASLGLNASFRQYRHKDFFVHAIQHEMGNILGFGDIAPTYALSSVQEDPWVGPIGPISLSDWDIGMMRQIYGESTCPESWR